MSIKFITTYMQDLSKVTNGMREDAKSEHQNFLDKTQNTFTEAKHKGLNEK